MSQIRDTERLLEGHSVCPTCVNARVGRCCSCGDPIPKNEQRLAVDIYSARVLDDKRFHLQCQHCIQQSHAETRAQMPGAR